MALRQHLESSSGVTLLGRMAATKSVARNLKAEDAAVQQNIANCEALLHEGTPGVNKQATPGGQQDMDLMAARDIHVHWNDPQKPPAAPARSAVPATPSAPTSPSPATAGMSNLGRAAVLASAILGSGGLGFGLANYFSQPAQFDPSQWQLEVMENNPAAQKGTSP